ncbi:N-acetylglucosamine kinase [Dyadobacter subterraneus]|uniref:N-acetylglucosamine kinase n=1 Tax=Dyadobacter subterraneus TaxID=2773304 RepID=A0ABR9WJM0_9BACT|nr:N-acetylglucosamine kinase [Dyadobacter subterraneus]MBE9465697.1 N-acetylglucosamine kinase [Dyadobacter subterraneus]
MKQYTYLIADSGSTKTDWLVATTGKTPFRLHSGGLNPFYQTKEEVTEVLEKEVLPFITSPIDQIFFYGAGCADKVTSRPIYDALVDSVPSAEIIEVASDMLAAARGLCGNKPGIACILGTGANNAFYDGNKIAHSIGSLGFWLGDEGSGSYLGKTLLVNFLQNELPQDLHEQFEETYPGTNRLFVLEKVYRQPFPNRYFATFSEFISKNIQHPFITKLVQDAFILFTEKYILKHQDAEKYPIHFTGSIAFYYREILKTVLESKGLQVGKIAKSPMETLYEYHLQRDM